ncbi:MAG TPA: CBS domain-containing protein [Terriglobia bacterium]|nr:CBS domain-containing protein [Terriglobia bacterium]
MIVYLSEFLGTAVVDSTGKKIGTVAEVAAQPGTHPPRVSRILLRNGKGAAGRAVAWREIESIERDRLRLRVPEAALAAAPADESLLLLRKDLLDQQIIDVNGRKVVRVNDLLLEKRTGPEGLEMLLSAVDIGVRGAVRRLLHGAVPQAWLRQIEKSVRENTIPWEFVDLIESDPRRQVKLHISHQVLTKLHPADLADIVEELAPKERQALFQALDDVTVAEALSEVNPKLRRSILESLGIHRAADIVEEMQPDAAADLLAELPEETTTELLQGMNREEAAEIGELLEHAENSAGGLMTTKYIALPHTADAAAARNLLRSIPDLPEQFNTLFLVDEGGVFMGSVTLARLIVAPEGIQLSALKSEPLLHAAETASEQDVIELFDKYNLLTLPVVDEQRHLVGAITADDVITVLNKKR